MPSLALCNPRGELNIVTFGLNGRRTCSINDFLSGCNVTIHAKRRYTVPLVTCCGIPTVYQTSLTVCGARRRISHLIAKLRHVRHLLKWRKNAVTLLPSGRGLLHGFLHYTG